MDETGLFYRMLPRYGLILQSEDSKTVRGKKKQKERVTLVVCANATGSHKLPLMMIGKYNKPACFNSQKCPLKYAAQKRAWMDIPTCWNWFNNVFFPEVRKRTSRPVLLLMDNAPGHFETFQRENVAVHFFPPNVTSWKQPCDLGMIAALKKRYKFLYLKDMLSFYELNTTNQKLLKDESLKMRRGSVGVHYGRPATLLDAAGYAEEAWNRVTEETVRNAFIKADLKINLVSAGAEIFENNEFVDLFNELNITATEEEINEFVTIDNENSTVFQQEVLDEANRFFEEDQLSVQPDEIYLSEEDEPAIVTSIQTSQATSILDDFYTKSVIFGGELCSAEMQAAAGNNFGKLKSAFENFQQILKKHARSKKNQLDQNVKLH